MSTTVFVWQESQPFNFSGFAKYLVQCPNVNWSSRPGLHCKYAQFLAALQIELNVDKESAEKVYKTMVDLGFVTRDSDWDVSVIERLRK